MARIAEQVEWLMHMISKKEFNVEYIVTGNGYSFTKKKANTLEEVIKFVVNERKHIGSVVMMTLAPVVEGKNNELFLMNRQRLL